MNLDNFVLKKRLNLRWLQIWVLIRMLLYCWLLLETTSVSKKKTLLDLPSDRTSVSLNLPLIRLVCTLNCLWLECHIQKWPLIRQVPDHFSDKSAVEKFCRPRIWRAPRTYECLKMVLSELYSVSPSRPGEFTITNPVEIEWFCLVWFCADLKGSCNILPNLATLMPKSCHITIFVSES